MLETGSEAGVFNDIEKEMITSIFSFDDKRARDVMVPRQEIVAVDINDPLDVCWIRFWSPCTPRFPCTTARSTA